MCVAVLLAGQALAAGGGTLEIRYEREGVTFHIYRAAQSDGSGGYTWTQDFAGSRAQGLDQNSNNGEWRSAAITLAAYAASQDLTPADSGRVSGGELTFSGLEAGLYLVVGESSTSGSSTYTPTPFLAYVGAGVVSADVKEDEDTTDPGGGQKTLRVRKVWEGGQDARPDSVTIQLVRDGENDRQITLSPDNDWTYTWNTEGGVSWQVVEVDVPEGFAVSVDRNGWVFTVTNQYEDQGDQPVPEEPDQPEPSQPDSSQPEPDQPSQPDQSGGGDSQTPEEPGQTQEGSKLPQTGQLWWPVAGLLLCGGGLIVAGLVRRKNDRSRHKK